jgi:hypothetical protein
VRHAFVANQTRPYVCYGKAKKKEHSRDEFDDKATEGTRETHKGVEHFGGLVVTSTSASLRCPTWPSSPGRTLASSTKHELPEHLCVMTLAPCEASRVDILARLCCLVHISCHHYSRALSLSFCVSPSSDANKSEQRNNYRWKI